MDLDLRIPVNLLRKKNHQPQPATQGRKPEDLANWAREFRAEYEREQAARPSPHQQWKGLFQREA